MKLFEFWIKKIIVLKFCEVLLKLCNFKNLNDMSPFRRVGGCNEGIGHGFFLSVLTIRVKRFTKSIRLVVRKKGYQKTNLQTFYANATQNTT